MLSLVTRILILAFGLMSLATAVAVAESCPSDEPDVPVARISFPEYREKFGEHGGGFYGVATAEEYRARAQDIAEGQNPGVESCPGMNGRTIYWDPVEGSMVIVQYGVITNYYRPTGGYEHYLRQCVPTPDNHDPGPGTT